jgi:hypothetical protein
MEGLSKLSEVEANLNLYDISVPERSRGDFEVGKKWVKKNADGTLSRERPLCLLDGKGRADRSVKRKVGDQ